MDSFERLGLPRRFSLDPDAVEAAYLARSRELHPDFHAGGSDAEQRASLELSAAVNEAYRTLTDPFRRAEYLVELLGGPAASQEKGMDQSFLMAMMDARDRLESGDDTVRDELTADADRRLTTIGATLDASPTPTDLTQVRRALNAVKTIRSLLRQ